MIACKPSGPAFDRIATDPIAHEIQIFVRASYAAT